MNDQIIIVGGGLAGLSAAHTILERGGSVTVIDKKPFFGGNSTKATSGINGALTNSQIKLNIKDSKEKFYEDTIKSARKLARPDLVKVLTYDSAGAVNWLQESFKIDLSKVSRLGGHSEPRTHRGSEMFPGMTITYSLMERLEELSKSQPSRVKILNKAKATKLIKQGDEVTGVEYEFNGKSSKLFGPVILATGGYAADFTEDSLLKKYRNDLINLPTTNGDHCTGDGIKMAREIGVNLVDMENVQVHPTGLIDPKEKDSKVKFLAAEALRGVGGLLINKDGMRFVDELQHRDFVTGKIWENKDKLPVRLVLNSKAGKEIEWHIKHYMGRGLMKSFSSGAELAKEIGCSAKNLENTFKEYNEAARTGKDKYQKKFFHNAEFKMNDTFFVALMTPVLHFTMGGVEINDKAELIDTKKNVVKGLFACGEMCGGVHGANRLGGSSLLACVVYGRVAGSTAASYQYSKLLNKAEGRLNTISNHLGGLQAVVNFKPGNKVSLEFSLEGSKGEEQQNNNNEPILSNSGSLKDSDSFYHSEPQSKENKQSNNKEFTMEEVAKHNKDNDCWVVVNGEVLDVTNFLDDHPGGRKAIMLYAGRDATEEFNMLHKKDVVEKYAKETILGKLKK